MMSYANPIRRADLANAKLSVARALKALGENANGTETTTLLLEMCRRHFAPRMTGEANIEYFRRVSHAAPIAPPMRDGEVVPPRVVDLLHRPEWKPAPHLREAEINALRPQIGVHGIGNGVNWSHVDR